MVEACFCQRFVICAASLVPLAAFFRPGPRSSPPLSPLSPLSPFPLNLDLRRFGWRRRITVRLVAAAPSGILFDHAEKEGLGGLMGRLVTFEEQNVARVTPMLAKPRPPAHWSEREVNQ